MPREIDCFTIALGKETGMTFPVDIHNQQVNALYDTGAGCSLINYSMYEKIGINQDKGYQPIVKLSTGENIGMLGQVTFTFKINDTSKPYTLYTDASKYGWAGMLTQSHTTVTDGKSVTTDHPVVFVSGLFRGSQLNWTALTKEAYAIYMPVKMLSFYLIQTGVLLKSDHLPLKRFLHKNTLNSKVNNWAMELESFNIQFEHIKGQNNILADTLSCFIDIDPDTQLTPEGKGYEFGYAVFEELPDIHTFEINVVIAGDKEIKNDPDLCNAPQCINNPIAPEQLKCLQEQDAAIETLKHKLTQKQTRQGILQH